MQRCFIHTAFSVSLWTTANVKLFLLRCHICVCWRIFSVTNYVPCVFMQAERSLKSGVMQRNEWRNLSCLVRWVKNSCECCLYSDFKVLKYVWSLMGSTISAGSCTLAPCYVTHCKSSPCYLCLTWYSQYWRHVGTTQTDERGPYVRCKPLAASHTFIFNPFSFKFGKMSWELNVEKIF